MAALVITPEIEEAVQQLANATGSSPAEALMEAVRRQAATMPKPKPPETLEEREARLREAHEILARLQSMPWDKSLTADEIIGYDQDGLPT